MRNIKLILVFILALSALGLFAQNANVSFKDATTTTRGYLNLEYPGGSYPAGSGNATNRWRVYAYTSPDAVIDPLSATGQPTNGDAFLQDLNCNIIAGTAGTLNLSAVVVPAVQIPTNIYLRIFNAVNFVDATKYMTFTAVYPVAAGGPINIPIIPTYGWKTDPVWNWITPPAEDTFQLTVNSTVNSILTGGYEIFKGGVSIVQDTQWTSGALANSATLVGTYTLEPVPGFHWVPASREVELDDFVAAKSAVGSRSKIDTSGAKALLSATITFDLVEDEPEVDYEEGVETIVAPAISIIVLGGDANSIVPVGTPDPYPNPASVPLYTETIELLGAGPWTITYNTTAPIGIWYSYAQARWFIVHNVAGTIVFNIPAGGKDIPEVPIALGDETLPVTLSSFTATLTAQNFVKLTWVSQSESNLLGYRVLRGDSDTQNDLTLLTPVMVQATNTSSTASYSVTDVEVAIGSMYYYWLESVEMDGSSSFHGPINVLVEGEVPPVLPTATSMSNAYPHPFRMSEGTNIDVNVKAGEAGTVTVYNILGQVVKTFSVKEGSHKLNWNGRDSKNNVCANGIYFYKLSTPSMNQTKKMVIVK